MNRRTLASLILSLIALLGFFIAAGAGKENASSRTGVLLILLGGGGILLLALGAYVHSTIVSRNRLTLAGLIFALIALLGFIIVGGARQENEWAGILLILLGAGGILGVLTYSAIRTPLRFWRFRLSIGEQRLVWCSARHRDPGPAVRGYLLVTDRRVLFFGCPDTLEIPHQDLRYFRVHLEAGLNTRGSVIVETNRGMRHGFEVLREAGGQDPLQAAALDNAIRENRLPPGMEDAWLSTEIPPSNSGDWAVGIDGKNDTKFLLPLGILLVVAGHRRCSSLIAYVRLRRAAERLLRDTEERRGVLDRLSAGGTVAECAIPKELLQAAVAGIVERITAEEAAIALAVGRGESQLLITSRQTYVVGEETRSAPNSEIKGVIAVTWKGRTHLMMDVEPLVVWTAKNRDAALRMGRVLRTVLNRPLPSFIRCEKCQSEDIEAQGAGLLKRSIAWTTGAVIGSGIAVLFGMTDERLGKAMTYMGAESFHDLVMTGPLKCVCSRCGAKWTLARPPLATGAPGAS